MNKLNPGLRAWDRVERMNHTLRDGLVKEIGSRDTGDSNSSSTIDITMRMVRGRFPSPAWPKPRRFVLTGVIPTVGREKSDMEIRTRPGHFSNESRLHANRHEKRKPCLESAETGLCLAIFRGRIGVFLSLVAFLCAPLAHPLAADTEVTQTRIDAGRKVVESATGLDETQKQQALEFYAQAEKWLREANAAKAEKARLMAVAREGPKKIKKLRARMEEFSRNKTDDPNALAPNRDPDGMGAAIKEEEAALTEAREARRQQMDILSELTVGAKNSSTEISANRKTMERISEDLNALASADDPIRVSEARGISLKTHRILIREKIAVSTLRQENHSLLVDLAQLERDMAEARIARCQARLDRLREAAGDLREEKATQARREAERDIIESTALPGAFRAIANETTQYRMELEDLARNEKTVAEALAAAKAGLDGIESDFKRIRQRVKVVGTGQAISSVLRARRAALPSMRSYRRASNERKEEIVRATDRQIHIDERLHAHGTVGDFAAKLMLALPDMPESERDGFERKARRLTQAQRDALNELQKVYGTYIGGLTALDLAKRRLVSVAKSYVDYIDDALRLIPDPSLLDLARERVFTQATWWLFSPANWSEFGKDVGSLARRYPIPTILLAGLLVVLAIRKRSSKARLEKLSRDAGKIRDYAFAYFLEAVAITLFIASWPLLIAGVGYLLVLSSGTDPFTDLLGHALFKSGLVLAGGLFLIEANRRDGIGERHLRWPAPIREAMLRELRWALPTVVSLGFLAIIMSQDGAPSALWPLGRLAFVILMMVFLVLAYRLFHAHGPFMGTWRKHPSTHLKMFLELHFLWFPLLLLLPFGLALLPILGYRTMSLHFLDGVEMTLWFFIGLFFLREFVIRYLDIAELRLRHEEAVRKRNELHAQCVREKEDMQKTSEEKPATLSSLMEIPEPDFRELGDQAKRLVQGGFLFSAIIGIWFIWSDLLSTPGFLGDAGLSFYAPELADGIAREVSITLGDVVGALILLVITMLAAKNIPGVLEIVLLQRLPLETGGRYAFATLTQYSIVGIGMAAMLGALGVEWSSIQWLVAALGIGLGFGLQEIVANFISGIILLFERPIRVGDVVTIDDTTGIVSRIRIRATTIIDWEKKELLVPNKDLITGRLTNWTLSNRMTRILITVGIAYGSDVALALRLLTEAATEHPEVLSDPAPLGTFEGFGDNALTLFLRCYMESVDNRLATTSALHQAINEKFNAAGISISFPQRDIHLDTVTPLDIRLVSS
uniref:Potassium efflux system protein n=1 Tax=Candidatus Kentrum sp. SD TaxID=2126332 RepID=A0A450YDF9_9GAMM|nr:MAG: potassium efflux system protein [Candidatus Kentron sp. SD]VFK44676.1 MAG: potassium efflux system protein [Candidatus Kentron sp. SD]